jgi:hypothetical protein
MAAVGFDMYTRLLTEAVEEEKAALEGRPPDAEPIQAVIDLPVDAYLPDDYVPQEAQKLELYRRLARAASPEDVAAVRTGLIDRFGPVPPSVERLLAVALLRLNAERAGIASISREEGQLVIRFAAGWSRAAAARVLGPGGGDGLRKLAPGGFTFASNQVRLRAPREGRAAWELTERIVDRLAQAAPAEPLEADTAGGEGESERREPSISARIGLR